MTVYDRTDSKMISFKNMGITCADSVQKAVSNANIVLSCLFDDASVLETITCENRILDHIPKDVCYVSTETILPKTMSNYGKYFMMLTNNIYQQPS